MCLFKCFLFFLVLFAVCLNSDAQTFTELQCRNTAKIYLQIENFKSEGIKKEQVLLGIAQNKEPDNVKQALVNMTNFIYNLDLKDKYYSKIFYKECTKPFYSIKTT